MTGSLIAWAQLQTYSVYAYTSRNTEYFTDQTVGAWSYSVVTHQAGRETFSVYDQTTQENILVLSIEYPNTYAGALGVTYGHDYMMHTNFGELTPPGFATCTVVSLAYNPDRPIQQ
jgi:hypothetical protein